jgi:hypothetical protein
VMPKCSQNSATSSRLISNSKLHALPPMRRKICGWR